MSSVRFAELVKRYGQPEMKSLWTRPEEDTAFTRAVKQRRVITISQEPGSKHKDFGEVGFHQRPHASYLVFPEPVKESGDVKVIGIKYELIREPDVKDALSPKVLKKLPSKKQAPTAEKPEKMPTFNIRLRRTATLEVAIPIEAKTKSEARKQALRIAEEQPFDASKADIKTEALGSK